MQVNCRLNAHALEADGQKKDRVKALYMLLEYNEINENNSVFVAIKINQIN